ncbi:MAG: recombinase family protein, partial [Pseudomonadota bacterium]
MRQSTVMQIKRNPESTDRQYGLLGRAIELGWPRERIVMLDDDLGLTGSGVVERCGFDRMAAEVGLGRVGIVLALEVSRLARNNADWYRLLDLCGITDTLIGDNDGLYHPNHFNDRLVLGLKGTMSEAELHILRERLNGGIRNKAARGELRRSLPVGFVWGEADGDVCFDPDEAVTNAIHTVFQRFAEMGSARQVWLWLRSEGLLLPTRANMRAPIRWGTPTYTQTHNILTNPVYASAYVYGKTRTERYVDESGNIRKRMHHLLRAEWGVLLTGHHEGFIDWATYEEIQERLAKNTRPGPHQTGGAVREGAALLQGLATCGQCGRR